MPTIAAEPSMRRPTIKFEMNPSIPRKESIERAPKARTGPLIVLWKQFAELVFHETPDQSRLRLSSPINITAPTGTSAIVGGSGISLSLTMSV
jgi:hypothetical protein